MITGRQLTGAIIKGLNSPRGTKRMYLEAWLLGAILFWMAVEAGLGLIR